MEGQENPFPSATDTFAKIKQDDDDNRANSVEAQAEFREANEERLNSIDSSSSMYDVERMIPNGIDQLPDAGSEDGATGDAGAYPFVITTAVPNNAFDELLISQGPSLAFNMETVDRDSFESTAASPETFEGSFSVLSTPSFAMIY